MQSEPIPLKYVVQEAVKRWFEDTLLEAQRGDVKQQALLGEMYKVGGEPRAGAEDRRVTYPGQPVHAPQARHKGFALCVAPEPFLLPCVPSLYKQGNGGPTAGLARPAGNS
jgi:hypothetical protein